MGSGRAKGSLKKEEERRGEGYGDVPNGGSRWLLRRSGKTPRAQAARGPLREGRGAGGRQSVATSVLIWSIILAMGASAVYIEVKGLGKEIVCPMTAELEALRSR